MEEFLSFGALIALTIGLTECVKRGLNLNSRYAPLVALAFGIIINLLATALSLTPFTFLVGIAIGLSASGLYSGTKASLGK